MHNIGSVLLFSTLPRFALTLLFALSCVRPTVFTNASTTNTVVVCGVTSEIGPIVKNDSTFLIQRCTNVSGTVLVLSPSVASVNTISVIVEDSRNVAVKFAPNNVSITIEMLQLFANNVTNDEGKLSLPATCSPALSSTSTCLPLLSISHCGIVTNVQVALSNMTHTRNQSVVSFTNMSSLTSVSIVASNMSMEGKANMVTIGNVSTTVYDCVVTLTDVLFTPLPVQVGNPYLPLSMILLTHTPLAGRLQWIVRNSTIHSFLGGSFAAMRLESVPSAEDSTWVVSSVNVVVASPTVNDVASIFSTSDSRLLKGAVEVENIDTTGDITLVAWINTTSIDHMSFLVSACRQVAAQFFQNATVDMTNFIFVAQDITNVAVQFNNRTPNPAKASTNLPLLFITAGRNVSNATIVLKDIAFVGTACASVVTLAYVATATGVRMSLDNITSVKSSVNSTVVTLRNITVDAQNCSVHATSVFFSSAAVSSSLLPMILVSNILSMHAFALLISDVTGWPAENGIAAIFLLGVAMCQTCVISVSDINFVGQLGTSVVVVFSQTVLGTQSTASAVNVTATMAVVRAMQLESCVVKDSAFSLDGLHLTSPADRISNTSGGFFVINDTFQNSTVIVTSAHVLSGPVCFGFLVHMDDQSGFRNVSIRISNSTASGNHSTALFITRTLLIRCTVLLVNISCVTQTFAIQIEKLLPQVDTVQFLVSDSYFAAAFPVYLTSVTATTFSLLVVASTLHVLDSALVNTYLGGLYCYQGSFVDSNITFASVRTISDVPSLPAAGQMLQLQQTTLKNTTLVAQLNSVETSGGIISVWSCTIDESSHITVSVLENITIAPSYARAIVYVYLTIIANRSSVEVILPRAARMISGSAAFGALYFDANTVVGSSLLRFAATAESMSVFEWPNNVAWLLSTSVVENSSFELAGLSAMTSSAAVILFFDCTVRSNSRFLLENVELSSASTSGGGGLSSSIGVSIFNAAINGNSSVSLGLICSLSQCANVVSSTLSDRSRLFVQVGFASISFFITSTSFLDSTIDLRILSPSTGGNGAAVNGVTVPIAIQGCTFTATSRVTSATTATAALAYFIQLSTAASIIVSTSNHTNALLIPLKLTATTVTAPWLVADEVSSLLSPHIRSTFVMINESSSGPTTMTFSVTATHLTMFGVRFLMSSEQRRPNVSLVTINCSWWARHNFTGHLAPLQTALQGTILQAAPLSALDASSIIETDFSVSTCDISFQNRNDASWTTSLSTSATRSMFIKPTPSTWSKSPTAHIVSQSLTDNNSSTESRIFPKATKTPTIIEESRSLTILQLRRSPSSKTSPSSTFSERSPDTETPVSSATHLTASKSLSMSLTRNIFSLSHTSTFTTISQMTVTEHLLSLSPTKQLRPTTVAASSATASETARPVVAALIGSLNAASGGAVLIRSSLSRQLALCASDEPGTNSSLSAALVGSSSSNLFQINVGSDDNAAGYGYRGVLVSSVVLVLGAALLPVAVLVAKHRIEQRYRQPSHLITWRTLTTESGLPGWWLAGPCAMA
ncbi:membrane-associated protein, putative, partial [Bodo saltans]